MPPKGSFIRRLEGLIFVDTFDIFVDFLADLS